MSRIGQNQANGSMDGEDAGMYIVDGVIDYKCVSGKEKFLVVWRGFPKQEATWQPAENIRNNEDDQWNQFFEECKAAALKRMARASKTKKITPACRSDRNANRSREQHKKTIHSHCERIAGWMAQEFPKLIDEYGLGQKEAAKTSDYPTFADMGMDIEEDDRPQQSICGCSSQTEREIGQQLLCPQKIERQFKYLSSQQEQVDEETMTPNFDDLQVTGIKERVIVGKHAFYELECSNGKPDKPIFLAERYVKLFLTEHLNRYNKKYPEEIDS